MIFLGAVELHPIMGPGPKTKTEDDGGFWRLYCVRLCGCMIGCR